MRAVAAMMALVAAALAQPATAQVQLAAYRPDMSAAQYLAAEQAQTLRDQIECREQSARDSKVTPMFMGVPGGSIVGALAVGAVTGVATGLMEINRGAGAMKSCMTARGYAPRDLTAAERAEWNGLSSVQRRKWSESTVLWAPRPSSQTYALLMWDVRTNHPVAVHRDPATGEIIPTWSVTR